MVVVEPQASHGPEEPAKKVLTQLVAAVGEDAKEELMTIAELLEEEGRKQGRLEGQKDALLTLLGARFGALPDDVIAKVREAGAGQLEDWLKRGGVVATLSDVLYVS